MRPSYLAPHLFPVQVTADTRGVVPDSPAGWSTPYKKQSASSLYGSSTGAQQQQQLPGTPLQQSLSAFDGGGGGGMLSPPGGALGGSGVAMRSSLLTGSSPIGGALDRRTPQKDRDEAPPVTSIYDTDFGGLAPLSDATALSPPSAPLRDQLASPQPRNAVSTASSSGSIWAGGTAGTSAARGPAGTVSGDSGCCVTVFGFPPSMASAVLQQFQKYGEIVRYKSGEGNFMHIQYSSWLEAQKALSRNGTALDAGSGLLLSSAAADSPLLIGVVPLSDQRMSGRESRVSTTTQRFQPTASKHYDVDYKAPTNVPKPRDSWWAKFMEYVFNI